VTLFLAKLSLTPLIMYLASAAGRRWGPGVSGWLTGLPLLAGPVSVFVCIEQGPEFAARAAGGTLLGMWSSCAFCLAYHSLARHGWAAASLASVVAFALATALLNQWSLPPWAGFVGVLVGAGLCLRLIPAPASRGEPVPSPAWDMPARLAIAAAFVVLQTGIAGWLGPQLSGLVTPFPIVVILLTAFSQHQLGEHGATRGAARIPDWDVRVRVVLSNCGLGIEPLGRRGHLSARARCVPGDQWIDAVGAAAAVVKQQCGCC